MIAKPNLAATLRAMELGDVEHIPVGDYTQASVRNCACRIAFDLMRKYSVHLDHTKGSYTVTRTQ